MKILSWALSDVGQKREHNEDSFLVDADFGLFVVADGMGGHAGGDQASSLAVSLIHQLATEYSHSDPPPEPKGEDEPGPLTVLRDAAKRAGETIFDMAQEHPHLSGMGTTLTALFLQQGRAYMAHVGDSRAYLFRDGRIEQLSEDHSWINEQVKAGLITDEEAKTSKFKHIITRSVGFERDVNVDLMSFPVLMGDCFLLCSDGLSNYVESEELSRLLTGNFYSQLPQLLVDIANDRGGDDNITVVLVYVANDTAEVAQPRRVPLKSEREMYADEETKPDLLVHVRAAATGEEDTDPGSATPAPLAGKANDFEDDEPTIG